MIKAFRNKTPRMDPSAFVARGAVVIGDVELGAQASIWYGCVIRGDINSIRIGARSNIQDLSVIHVNRDGNGVTVGQGVTVGHRVILHDCTVGDQVVVGMGAVVLDGARIGDGAFVGAGAVVSPGSVVPPGSLALGVPAKVVRPVNEKEVQFQLGAAQRYVDILDEHRALGR